MRQLIAELDAQPTHVVGFSMGGYLALERVVASPHNVLSLTLICSSANGLKAEEIKRRQRALAALRDRSYAGIPAVQMANFVGSANLADEAVVGVVRDMDRSLGKPVFLAQMSATMDRPSLTGQLPGVSCPLLIVGSEDDRMIDANELRTMHAAVPGSRLVMLHGVGHMIPLEAPQALSREMSRFWLDAQTAPRA